MSQRRVFVLGNSHTKALSDALAAGAAFEGVDIESCWLQSQKADRVVGDMPFEQACERVAALGPDDLFVLSIFGAYHNIYGLLDHEQPLWLLPEGDSPHESVPPGRSLVPRRVIQAWFRGISVGNKRVDTLLKRCTTPRRFHLMTPPPKGDNDFIAARTTKYRSRSIADYPIASPVLRQRLWAIERAALREALGSQGVGLIDPPGVAVDGGGFLAADFYGEDATHANLAYGRLVLRQLADLARSA